MPILGFFGKLKRAPGPIWASGEVHFGKAGDVCVCDAVICVLHEKTVSVIFLMLRPWSVIFSMEKSSCTERTIAHAGCWQTLMICVKCGCVAWIGVTSRCYASMWNVQNLVICNLFVVTMGLFNQKESKSDMICFSISHSLLHTTITEENYILIHKNTLKDKEIWESKTRKNQS